MRTVPIATTALLLFPGALRGEELRLGLRSGVSWNDNVFGTPDNAKLNGQDDPPQDDYSLRLTPSLELVDTDGAFTWALRYQPSYEAYLDFGDLDGFDQTASGSASWHFADRWRLKLDESYALFQSATRFNQAAGPGEEVVLGFQNFQVQTNSSRASLEHDLTPLDTLSLGVSYRFLDYQSGGGNNRKVPSVTLDYRHKVSERTGIGAKLSWVQQNFDSRVGGSTNSTNFYNLSATFNHSLTRRLRLETAAGPTWIDASPVDNPTFQTIEFPVANTVFGPFVFNADNCSFDGVTGRAQSFAADCKLSAADGITASESSLLRSQRATVPALNEQGIPVQAASGGSDFTYFARIALVRDWETWNARLVYQRQNSEQARFGSSTVVDSLTGIVTVRPFRHWILNASASLSLQQQTVDQQTPIAYQLTNVPAPSGVSSVSQLAQVEGLVVTNTGNDVKYRTESASATITRELTERSSVFASVFWYAQKQKVGDVDTRWNNLTVWIGFDWYFDPIRF